MKSDVKSEQPGALADALVMVNASGRARMQTPLKDQVAKYQIHSKIGPREFNVEEVNRRQLVCRHAIPEETFDWDLVPEGKKAWDMLKGEIPKIYSWFLTYRDLGLNRTIPNAARKVGKTPPMLAKQSAAWYWLERCALYDRHILEKDKERMELTREKIHSTMHESLLGLAEINKLITDGSDEDLIEVRRRIKLLRETGQDNTLEQAVDMYKALFGDKTKVEHSGKMGLEMFLWKS